MKDYVLASAAELDLDAMWEYIAVDNVDAADRWMARLFYVQVESPGTPPPYHRGG